MDYEKLGAFYLGRVFDPKAGRATDELLLYDAKDLTTHAVCVGMTGSGKTGLCVVLLEEAAIDGIPAIVIDPKGDLGSLLLGFPELRAEDFEPWIDPAEATRDGVTPAELARATAERWRKGLADWGQDGSRIARLRATVDLALYTPGSTAGRPLRLLDALAPPASAVLADDDLLRERVSSAVASLLSLLGIEADPLRSREHLLLAQVLEHAWREGRSLDLAGLIQAVQQPPFSKIGVMDLESAFPAKDRFALAMGMNQLVASPSFRAWSEGEPLDAAALLHTAEGKPRLSVLSIAHLDDRERMFFVTQLLSEMVSWMRKQGGTGSLRAILYMDEIFGYFPPSASPPSKAPMLTLLKQARSVGLGVVLATQNPVDLDYKGLANCGTWFLGRLQTERDKARVLDGLESAAGGGGPAFDRAALDALLSGLPGRVFLMNDVHESGPVLFQTRSTLSYLRGPLSREQMRALAARAPAAGAPAPRSEAEPRAAAAPAPAAVATPDAPRPVLPPDVPQRFLAATRPRPDAARCQWRPALLGAARLHFVEKPAGLDAWQELRLLATVPEDAITDPWPGAALLAAAPGLATASDDAGGAFAPLPGAAAKAKSYGAWAKQLASFVQREHAQRVLSCADPKRIARPGQTEGEFRAELAQALRERRDAAVAELRQGYERKFATLRERAARARERVEREAAESRDQKIGAAVSLGATVLGALFGRRRASATTVSRASSALRSASRALREGDDVARAEDRVEDLEAQIQELDRSLAAEVAGLAPAPDAAGLALESRAVAPRKADLAADVLLVWTPWWITADGRSEPAFG